MTSTFTKISISIALIAIIFGLFGFFSNSNIFINNASAATGCSDCGGGSTGGGTVDGGSDGGGSSVQAPVCNITANITSVNAGGQYTVSWNGQPSSASFKMNGTPVLSQDSVTVTFDGQFDYMRYVLYGKNTGGECSKEVVVYKNVVAPICEISANISTVEVGGKYTVTWNGMPSTGVFKINGNLVADSGSAQFTFVGPNTEKYTITGINGSKTCSKELIVSKKVVEVPTPICDSFTASPTSIVRGNSSTLTWATTNATGVSINQTIGSVAVDGTRVVSPTITTIYLLTATKDARTVTCPVTVTVTDVPTPLTPICNSFTANATTINRGQSSTLTWNTTNVNTVSINNAIGSVGVDGNVTVSPLQTITYTLTGTGANNQQVSCPVTITVNQPDAAITCAANVNFSANNNSINRGDSSTLTWSTNGLANVRFDNLNSTGLSGSINVNPSDSTTYTLIGTKGNETINCPVTINVSSSNGGGGGSSAVKCSLKISDNKISRGDRVTLKWDTTRATEVTIKDNHGKTLIDTDGKSSSQKKDLYDGELTLRPEKDTTYTLVAEKGSKDKTCKVTVDVEDTVVVTQVRDQQPLVTGIALTNVPYTGFEAGPFMTSVFYTLLAAWALYMAYVLVGRRNGMNASAFTPATVTSDIVPSTMMVPEKVTATPAFYQTPTAVAATTATVGYEAHTTASEAIESQAHAQHVLLSTDAIAYFIGATANEDRTTVLAQVLTAAKASYPSEEGWVVISADRMVELAAKF